MSGSLTVEEALRRLLAGTGVTFSFAGTSTVTLARPDAGSGAVQLDPFQVQGAFPVPPQAMIDNLPPPYAGGQVATGSQLGLLGNREVMDTPFNQTSYTAKKAQDQQATTLRDVLIYTSPQYVDTTWPRRSLPEWTRFDLGARYTFENPAAKGKVLVARFNVENLLDADYWEGGASVSQLSLGAPRTFRLSLTADF